VEPKKTSPPKRARVRLNACTARKADRTDDPPAFRTGTEAAAFLRVSPVTLGRWRIQGRGPRFRKFGRRVVYAQVDLIAWADGQVRSSTSQSSD